MKRIYQTPVFVIEKVNVVSMLAVASDPKVTIGDGTVDPGDLDAKADADWEAIWGKEE